MSAAAARTLAVLNTLASAAEGLTLAQLVATTGIARSTLVRLMESLVEEHAVLAAGDPVHYRASLRVLEPAVSLLRESRVREISFPYMVELARATHYQVNLSLPEMPDTIGVESVLVTNGVVRSQPVFVTHHCLENASGRVIAAFRPEEEVESALACPIFKATEFTRTSPMELRVELEKIRKDGYALIDREQQSDLSGLAVPLLGAAGLAVGALGVSRRIPLDREFVETVLQPALYASTRVSAELGFRARGGFSVA